MKKNIHNIATRAKKSVKSIALFISVMMGLNTTSFEQCAPDLTPPDIVCPTNITVNTDPATCGAIVNFSNATATDNCSVVTTTTTFNFTGSIETFVVPSGVTSITVEVYGAQGGNGTAGVGGLGAFMSGDISVTPGQVIDILVGEHPLNANGGGGGTFVVDQSTGNPIIIAGGGGGGAGACCGTVHNGEPGVISTNGTAGVNASGGTGNGGTAGNGGEYGFSGQQSGAGGGFFTNGADGDCSSTGGRSYILGGAGGVSGEIPNQFGGFGGGGGGHNCGWGVGAGGGGGGYSGGGSTGGGGQWGGGGGGGSFNSGINQNNASGNNSGNGFVVMTYSGVVSVNQTSGLISGSVFPVGVSTVSFEAEDESGNTSTCSFEIEVIDTEAPSADVATLSDVTADCIIDDITAPTATDACSGTITGVADVTFPITNQGTTTITWTFEDGAGNVSTQTQDAIINIAPVDVTTTHPNLTTIVANNASAEYQWVDCNNMNNPISGAINQTFIASQDGSYAVVVTNGACSDTSDCVIVLGVGLDKDELNNILIYPNPTGGNFTIDLGASFAQALITISDATGRIIEQIQISETSKITTEFIGSSGIYFIEISADNTKTTRILIKE